MKATFIVILFTALFFSNEVFSAPPAYAFRVKFKNKNGTHTFADSLSFLSQKSLDRRSKQNISLDSSDLPVVANYISQVMMASSAVKLHNVSKWFNQIVIITLDSSTVTNIAALPMVESVKLVARYPNGVYKTLPGNTPDKFTEEQYPEYKKTRGSATYYGLAFQQIDIMEGDFLHDKGYKGEGMDIAVFDVNFRYTNTCTQFDSLISQNRVKDVYNFARDTPYVYSVAIVNSHGTNVLSCLAANMPGSYVGTAPNANYHLYITEDWLTEQPIEEDNWLSAAERVDSIGVYVVNSSLGYNIFTDFPSASYNYSHLDGNTSLIAKAANKLVSKGVFLVNAQGNEGSGAWHYMMTPSDADSVYSVGSVNGAEIWGGTGYGPTFDGRIKPDGMGMGTGAAIVGGACTVGASNGSSFAAPMVCGSIACLWQSSPHLNAFQLRRIVRMSSDRYEKIVTSVDTSYAYGYGIPNFEKAYGIVTGTSPISNIDYTFTLYPNPCDGNFEVRSYDPSIENVAYSVYDMSGKLMYKSDKLINANFRSNILQGAPSGEYVLLIATVSKVFSTKVIKL
jgi:serine protease AprX